MATVLSKRPISIGSRRAGRISRTPSCRRRCAYLRGSAFFTGRYAHSHRNRVNYTPLDRSEVLMQARLKQADYQTAAIGKLHYTPPTPDVARHSGWDLVELHDSAAFTDEWSDDVKWRQENDPKKDLNYHA